MILHLQKRLVFHKRWLKNLTMQTNEKHGQEAAESGEYYCPYCHRTLIGEPLEDGSFLFMHEDVMHHLYDPDYDYNRPN